MNQLQTTELLDRAYQLNTVAEHSLLSLAVVLSDINDTKAYQAKGYEKFSDYIVEELKRSKGTGSKLLKVGEFLKQGNYEPEAINTTYSRLYESINLLPEGNPEEVIAHATTLSESEIISRKNQEKAGVHECQAVCKTCKRLM